MKNFKLIDFYGSQNLSDQQPNSSTKDTKPLQHSVAENVLEYENYSSNNYNFMDDDKFGTSMFPSLNQQYIRDFEDNLEGLQPTPSMQLLNHVFKALTDPKKNFAPLPNKFTKATEKKSIVKFQSVGTQAGKDVSSPINSGKEPEMVPAFEKFRNETDQRCNYSQGKGPVSNLGFNQSPKPLCNFDFDKDNIMGGFKNSQKTSSQQDTENQHLCCCRKPNKKTSIKFDQQNQQESNLKASESELPSSNETISEKVEINQINKTKNNETDHNKDKSTKNVETSKRKNTSEYKELLDDLKNDFSSKQNKELSQEKNSKVIKIENKNKSANDRSKVYSIGRRTKENDSECGNCWCCYSCYPSKGPSRELLDAESISQKDLLILKQQQDMLQLQLQQIMQQYRDKQRKDLTLMDKGRNICEKITESDDDDYDTLINLLETMIEKRKKRKKILVENCTPERRNDKKIPEPKEDKNSLDNSRLKSVKIKRIKVQSTTDQESNPSLFNMRDNQSRLTDVSGLTLAENRNLETDQSQVSIAKGEEPRISVRYPSKKLGKNTSNRKSRTRKNSKYKKVEKSNKKSVDLKDLNDKLLDSNKKLLNYVDIFKRKTKKLIRNKRSKDIDVNKKCEFKLNKVTEKNTSKTRKREENIKDKTENRKLSEFKNRSRKTEFKKKYEKCGDKNNDSSTEDENEDYADNPYTNRRKNEKRNHKSLNKFGIQSKRKDKSALRHRWMGYNSLSDEVNSSFESDGFKDSSDYVEQVKPGRIDRIINDMKKIITDIKIKKIEKKKKNELLKRLENLKKQQLSEVKNKPSNHRSEEKKEKIEKEKTAKIRMKTEKQRSEIIEQTNISKKEKPIKKLSKNKPHKQNPDFVFSSLKIEEKKEDPSKKQTEENTWKDKLEKNLLVIEDLTFRKIGLFEEVSEGNNEKKV